jgi:general secretion pathway protein C
MTAPTAARWLTLLAWAAVAASAAAWGLKLWVKPAPLPPQTQLASAHGAPRADLSRLLGAEAVVAAPTAAPEPAADARFTLVGVLSPRSARAASEGVALIAVDGQPAKAYRIGAVVDGEQVLRAVSARGASLGPREGPVGIALTLPPPEAAATGVLPPAANGARTTLSPGYRPPATRPMQPGFQPGIPQNAPRMDPPQPVPPPVQPPQLPETSLAPDAPRALALR